VTLPDVRLSPSGFTSHWCCHFHPNSPRLTDSPFPHLPFSQPPAELLFRGDTSTKQFPQSLYLTIKESPPYFPFPVGTTICWSPHSPVPPAHVSLTGPSSCFLKGAPLVLRLTPLLCDNLACYLTLLASSLFPSFFFSFSLSALPRSLACPPGALGHRVISWNRAPSLFSFSSPFPAFCCSYSVRGSSVWTTYCLDRPVFCVWTPLPIH